MQQKQVKLSDLCHQVEYALLGYGYSNDSRCRYKEILKELQDFTGKENHSPTPAWNTDKELISWLSRLGRD